MKRAGYRMGALGMGIFICAILVSLIVSSASANISVSCTEQGNDLDNSSTISDDTRSKNNIWYIYTLKEIIDNRTFDRPIIINSSGELRIKNNARFEIAQDYDYHRNITIKNNGTLTLRKGTLKSNKKIGINLESEGKLILENNSILKVTKINCVDNSMLKLGQSTILPGIGGLEITMNDQSALDLDGSAIDDANNIAAKDQSVIKIKNSEINSDNFEISCKEIKISSNKIFRDLKVDRCDYGYILSSSVKNIEIDSCGFMHVSQGSMIEDCKFNDVKVLDIDQSSLKNVKIKEVDSTLVISNSVNITDVTVENCTTLEIKGSKINNFHLEHFSYDIEIYNSIIEQSSLLPKKIKIYDSTFSCTQAQLDIVTRATNLEAYNSTFNYQLKFSGTSIADLVNCSTLNKIPPKVRVYDDAKVDIYWWLDVQVVDAQNVPLPGASVSMHDFFTNEKITSDISDSNGKIKFKLLANTLTKRGWKTIENNSYFIKGKYMKKISENNSGIFMEENSEGQLKFKNVNAKKTESKPILTEEVIVYILILVVVIILIGLSVSSRTRRIDNKATKGNGRDRDAPEYLTQTRTNAQPNTRIRKRPEQGRRRVVNKRTRSYNDEWY